MKTYNHGQQAPFGVYVSFSPLDMCYVGAEGEVLEGRASGAYRRVPTLAALAFAPIGGGIFVLALPLIVFAAVLIVSARWAVKSVRSLVGSRPYLHHAEFQLNQAFFTSPNGTARESGDAEGQEDESLEELVDEVRQRRQLEDAEQDGKHSSDM